MRLNERLSNSISVPLCVMGHGSTAVATPNRNRLWDEFLGKAESPQHTHLLAHLTFSEDRMVGVCEECDEVVHVMVFPGSLNTIRARILIETYAANKLASRYDDEVISIGDVAEEINMLRKLLGMDIQELELAFDRLQLIETDLVANM